MTDEHDWDAAAAEAGYLPTSDYVKRWLTARSSFDAAQEANRKTMDALEEATIAYHDAVIKWLQKVGAHQP